MKKAFFILCTLILACCVAAVTAYVIWGDEVIKVVSNSNNVDELDPRKIYSIRLKNASVPPRRSDNKKWDVDSSAPDCYYQIWWRGNKIAESSVVKNSLLPAWSKETINIHDIISTGEISARYNSVRIKAGKDDKIIVFLYDNDWLNSDDLALKAHLELNKLHVGDNIIKIGEIEINLNIVPVTEES